MIDEEISHKEAIIDSSNSNESVCSNENENGSKTNVADGSGEIKKESVLINSSNQMQKFYKEKPKVPSKKTDNDIEEFDTDEEDDSTNQDSTKQTCSDNISYEGDKCIYTEPGTGRKLLWNTNENKWVPAEPSSENENATDAMKDYKYDGKNYVYTDKTTNVTYKFLNETNEWVKKNDEDEQNNEDSDIKNKGPNPPNQSLGQGVYGYENDTHTYTDPNDGTAYFWDREKNAWFPKVDDDFMARYQMNYGFTDSSDTSSITATENKPKPPEPPTEKKLTKEEKKAENKRKAAEPPKWFEIDEAHNTTVYISNLPLDITLEELKELVCKCGLLARDEKAKDKLKLYTDPNGEAKGDARCTYIKVESVELALNILDGWQIRDNKISVQRAKFELKGQYDPSKKPKRKKKDKEKQKKVQERLLDWRPDRMRGEPLKCERVVIIKNLFQPEDFEKDVTLLLDYQKDVRSECEKCGEVNKVTIYDRHPEGVVQVNFKDVEQAQTCIKLLNGRWFGQRRITAEIWDGRTKYKIKETDEQIEARLNKWDKDLEEEEESKEKARKDAEEKSKNEPLQPQTSTGSEAV